MVIRRLHFSNKKHATFSKFIFLCFPFWELGSGYSKKGPAALDSVPIGCESPPAIQEVHLVELNQSSDAIFNQPGGLPTVNSYDTNGNLETQVTPTAQSADGTTLTVPLNSVLLGAGSHILALQSPGSSSTFLSATQLIVNVFVPPPPPPSCQPNLDCQVQ